MPLAIGLSILTPISDLILRKRSSTLLMPCWYGARAEKARPRCLKAFAVIDPIQPKQRYSKLSLLIYHRD
jgi:hypothetical protein